MEGKLQLEKQMNTAAWVITGAVLLLVGLILYAVLT